MYDEEMFLEDRLFPSLSYDVPGDGYDDYCDYDNIDPEIGLNYWCDCGQGLENEDDQCPSCGAFPENA